MKGDVDRWKAGPPKRQPLLSAAEIADITGDCPCPRCSAKRTKWVERFKSDAWVVRSIRDLFR